LYFMYLTVFSLLIASSNSSFVLSLHCPFAFCVGPNILLKIFLSNANNSCLMFSVKTQHSDQYTATGLIRALYNFILAFIDIGLLWSIFWFAKDPRLPGPPSHPRKYSWYSLLGAESNPGPWCGRKDNVDEKFQLHQRESNPQPTGL